MIKKLFLLSFIIIPQMHAMKRNNQTIYSAPFQPRRCTNNQLQNTSNYFTQFPPRPRRSYQLQNTKKESFFPPYESWIKDIQKLVIDYATVNTTAKKPKEATRTVNALACTNKNFNALINDPQYSDNLTTALSHKFYCSHETIAKFLHTKQTKKQLILQYQLKNMCLRWSYYREIESPEQQLDTLITKGVKLEFTYNIDKNRTQKTPLMIAFKYNNSTITQLLLKKGANINNATSHSLTVLRQAIQFPITPGSVATVLQQPGIMINQLDRHKTSTLLYALRHRKRSPTDIEFQITPAFIDAIKALLEAGADPELADDKGTPLEAAELLNNNELITIIQKAIDKKQQQKALKQ